MAIDAALGRLGIRPGVCTSSTRPANPFEGQVIYETDTNNIRFWSGSAWESNKGGIISSSAPTGAAAGDIWYDSDDGRTYIYYDDGSSQQWVEFGAAPSGSSITLASYADSAARDAAITSPTEADLVYLQDTNAIQFYDGSSWKGISKMTKVAAFTTSGTWTVPAGVTYAVAHMRGGGGGANFGTGNANQGGTSSVAFSGGTVEASGGAGVQSAISGGTTASSVPATNSGDGGHISQLNGYGPGQFKGQRGAYIVAGDTVTPAASITVTVGAGGTGHSTGAAGYVWIEYQEPS
jgi:hypothetical protein